MSKDAFCRHTFAKILLFVAFSVPFAHYAVSKGSGGDRGGNAAPPPAGPLRDLDPEPAATNAPAALRFTSIAVDTNGVSLVASFDPAVVEPGDTLLLHESLDIASNEWSAVERRYVPGGETNMAFFVAYTNPPPEKAFYRLAQGLRVVCMNLPYAVRADGSRLYVSSGGELSLTTTGGPEGEAEPGNPPADDPFADLPTPHEYDPTNGTLVVSSPCELAMPNGDGVLCLSPSVTFGGSHKYHGDALLATSYDGWLGVASYVEIPSYPLASECLWEAWHEGTNAVGESVCSCTPELDFGFDVSEYGFITSNLTVTGETAYASVQLNGTNIWSGSAVHDPEGSFGGGSDYFTSDPCGGCGSCTSGDCDALDGPSLGSVRFRLALGMRDERHVSGFLWFSRDAAFLPRPSSFELLKRSDANVSDATADGVRTVICSDPGGRTVVVSNIEDGVRLDVTFTATGGRDRAWEITREGGAVRFRKFSAGGNVMSDVSYAPSGGAWAALDNTSGVVETKAEEGSLTEGGWRWTETVRSCGGVTASVVRVKSEVVGWGPDALPRETERMERRADGTWSRSYASYWEWWAGHGNLRMERGDDRAWSWHAYDGRGREKFRLDQRGGSAAPDDSDGYSINDLPESTDAFATVLEYEPHPGDSCDTNDWDKVRTESRYVVHGGESNLVSRTWTVYARGVAANGWPTVTETTIRAASQTAQIGDGANAVSSRTVYSSDSALVPYLLRGETAAETDEDGVTETHWHTIASNVVRTVVTRTKGGHEAKTRSVTDRDLDYGLVLYEATRLASDPSVEFGWRRHLYDSRRRLRFTEYDDGSSETNEYSCCRLLSRTDRSGAKTLMSAKTGTERLYHAEEEVYMAQLPPGADYNVQGLGREDLGSPRLSFRITQHFFDAFGRETNTLASVSSTPHAATNSTYRGNELRYNTSATCMYPNGFPDLSVSVDERGAATRVESRVAQECDETVSALFSSEAPETAVSVTTNRTFRGGGSLLVRVADGKSAATRSFSEYTGDGCRVDYSITESSDCGVVTNSVSEYDFLGRLVRVTTPVSRVENLYEGASSMVSSSQNVVSGVAVTNIYDEVGELVGTDSLGVSARSPVSYVQTSNAWWRVDEDIVFAGSATNRCSARWTRLTGLSDETRSESFDIVDGVVLARTVSSYNPATSDATVRTESQTDGVRESTTRYGRLWREVGPEGTTRHYLDYFGWVYYVKKAPPGGAPKQRFWYVRNSFGDVVEEDTFHSSSSTGYTSRFMSYDSLGRLVSETNAVGDVVTHAYDADGRAVADDGATWPVRRGYDTAGRATSLRTTRDGTAWDETGWAYDAATGLCTAKTYADNSLVSYTYTADGLPLRETKASGAWRESVYDGARRVIGIVSSDGEQDCAVSRDVFGRIVGESNGVCFVSYALDSRGGVTNEVLDVEGQSKHLARAFDEYGRIAESDGLHFEYAPDGRMASASNEIAVAEYTYDADREEAGYTLVLSNGVVVSRTLARKAFLRAHVTNVVSSVNGNAVESFSYSYDALGRPTGRNSDSFGYNSRSEVTSATVSGLAASYGYDEIGNSTLFTPDCVNQYGELCYDADGNLLVDGCFEFTYDSAGRLKTASTNGWLVLTNFYDAKSRRVKKVTPEATHTYFYDDWNLVEERVAYAGGAASTIRYYWGKDLSGTLHGAGGVGGLLYLAVSNSNS
ncbi:MAG: RHS repeat protein, partial [Kiritimatiellae bacterium]|nr:RHS repeat protein [Kiritimatiellia bacterium]